MSRGQVWFVDFDPVRGREQGKDRPALVVSSRFHLDLTRGQLVCVLPLTSVERPGWLHRVPVVGAGWVATEQTRTVSAERFRRHAPKIRLSAGELEYGLTTVAEGVESEALLERLAELGVDRAQGYLFGMPEPVEW